MQDETFGGDRGLAQEGAHVPRHLGLALVVIAAAQLMIVLDATIVNVALPQMQRALGFTGSGLEWIVTAYSLAFGSLLLLGGRLGDLYGRRRIFMTGVAVFSIGSLLGGFANGEEFLLSARVLQGAGAALAAPTALALIATTFPPGQPRNRALGVYAGMSGAGGAIGLLLGGILTSYVSWRWVFFVNVPIGLTVFALSRYALATSGRQRGRLDVPGVITSTAGLALLVYGLTEAAAGQDGVSHWGDGNVIAALAASAVLLIGFVFIETRSTHPELPLHLLKSRRRSGAYIMMLLIGTAMFAVFFFLTLFTQTVLGFSPVKAGVAWVPFPLTIIVVSMLVARVLLTRIGVRPLLLVGPLLAGIGFMWLSQISVTSTYWANLLPPMLVVSAGLGLMFVPLTLMVVSHVPNNEQGAASGVLNVGQQIGGAIGLAAIGTIAWTAVASSVQTQMASGAGAAAAGAATGPGGIPLTVLYKAMADGFSTGLMIAGGVTLIGFLVAIVTTWTPGRVRLSSAVHQDGGPSCDEALGTCEGATA
jgi:EmrB/QacA subfamily drug resistance transporter